MRTGDLYAPSSRTFIVNISTTKRLTRIAFPRVSILSQTSYRSNETTGRQDVNTRVCQSVIFPSRISPILREILRKTPIGAKVFIFDVLKSTAQLAIAKNER